MCTRWKDNGLPRKGWIIKDTEDMEDLIETCDWCGTDIRYVHWIYHEKTDKTTKCGIICAESLTNDYVSHKAKEKALRNISMKKIRRKKSFEKNINLTCKGNYYLKFKGNRITFYRNSRNKFVLCINNQWGKQEYNNLHEAINKSYNYLYGRANRVFKEETKK